MDYTSLAKDATKVIVLSSSLLYIFFHFYNNYLELEKSYEKNRIERVEESKRHNLETTLVAN